MIANIYEIFDLFKAAKTKEEKQNVLRKHDCFALRCVLRATFHPNIRFVIKDIPEYKSSDSPPGMGENSLHNGVNKLYLWEENNPRIDPNLTLERKTILLIQMLESLETREAQVLENIIKKDQGIPGLTYELVDETFPGVLA